MVRMVWLNKPVVDLIVSACKVTGPQCPEIETKFDKTETFEKLP